MALYEVTVEGRYFNQQTINRWNYVGTGTPAAVTPSFGLLSILGFLPVSTTFLNTTVAGRWQGLVNPNFFFIQAVARAVYVDDDFYGNGFLANTIGINTVGGNPMSPISSFGFRSNRVKQSIGRGYKRFAGVAEAAVGDGGVFTSGTLGAMELLAEVMGETLVYDDEGNSLTYVPCVVQKLKYTTPSGKEAYKYYPSEAAQAPHIAEGVNWEVYDTERSQVSRQYGHGR